MRERRRHRLVRAESWRCLRRRLVGEDPEWLPLAGQALRGGDQVFILGFSRGAYSVPSLVGLIRNAGLLYPEHGRRAADAYVLYRSSDEGTNPPVPAGGAAATPKQPDPRQGKPPKGACDAV